MDSQPDDIVQISSTTLVYDGNVPINEQEKFVNNMGIGTYIIILFAATILVLIWSFFILCYFSLGRRRGVTGMFHNPPFTTSTTTTNTQTTANVICNDLPPKYESAIDTKVFVSTLVLNPKSLEEAPPKYKDIVK